MPAAARAARLPTTTARGRGWYRGDLHAHTTHSDATWEVADLLAWALENRLDFCTLSDHNTIAGLTLWDASTSDALLTISGSEVTTFWGHALALGVRDWVDWHVRPDPEDADVRTMRQVAREVHTQGGLFIIAHPRSVGDPDCTGCRWLFESMMPGTAVAVEVWNENWTGRMAGNEGSLALAFEWLNQGRSSRSRPAPTRTGPNTIARHRGLDLTSCTPRICPSAKFCAPCNEDTSI